MFIGRSSHADKSNVEASEADHWDEYQYSYQQQNEPGVVSVKGSIVIHTQVVNVHAQ